MRTIMVCFSFLFHLSFMTKNYFLGDICLNQFNLPLIDLNDLSNVMSIASAYVMIRIASHLFYFNKYTSECYNLVKLKWNYVRPEYFYYENSRLNCGLLFYNRIDLFWAVWLFDTNCRWEFRSKGETCQRITNLQIEENAPLTDRSSHPSNVLLFNSFSCEKNLCY